MQNKIITLLILFLSGCSHIHSQENTAAAHLNASLGLKYLEEQHDTSRAKQKLLLAQHEAPHDPAAWYAMGYFLEKTGDAIAAEKSYKRAIYLAPHDGPAKNNYGTFLCRHGQYRLSVHYFLSAANEPSYLNTGQAYQNAALCAEKIPDPELAAKYSKRAEGFLCK